MGIFFVAGIGISVFIELLLLSKKEKSAPDRILTLWMFVIAVHLFLFYLFYAGAIGAVPFLLGAELPIPILHGVFLYVYVSYLTNRLPGDRKLLLLHFVPAAAMYLYLVTFFLLPAGQKVLVYRNKGAGFETFNLIRHYAVLLSGVVYVVLSIVLLKRHRAAIRDQFSDLEKINLLWLQILTYGLGCIWLLLIVFSDDTLVFSAVVAFIFVIGFFGVRQTSIFAVAAPGAPAAARTAPDAAPPAATPPAATPPAAPEGGQKEKYQKSGLSGEASEELHRSLLLLMTGEKLYRKSDLSVNDLAARLDVHPNYLSQVINQREGRNFYDFVNTYRIEEFKEMLSMQKNRQFTLLSLAFDCGFSSKTAFNRYFKKVTGRTPSEYAESLSGA